MSFCLYVMKDYSVKHKSNHFQIFQNIALSPKANSTFLAMITIFFGGSLLAIRGLANTWPDAFSQDFFGSSIQTALCFILLGSTIIFSNRNSNKLAWTSAAAMMAICLWSILLIMRPQNHLPNQSGSELNTMNLGAFLCLFLMAIIIPVVRKFPKYHYFSLWGAVVASVGLISLIGHINKVPVLFQWNLDNPLSLSVSIGLLVGGTSTVLFGSHLSLKQHQIYPNWTVYALATILFGFAIGQYAVLRNWENHQIHASVKTQLEIWVNSVEQSAQMHAQTLVQSAKLWHFNPELYWGFWQQESEMLLADLPNLVALSGVDFSSDNAWALSPQDLTLPQQEYSDWCDVLGDTTFESSKNQTYVVSKVYRNPNGQHLVNVTVPLAQHMRQGLFTGVFSFYEWAYPYHDPSLLNNFHLSIVQNQTPIFENSHQLENQQHFGKKTTLVVGDREWDISLQPTHATILNLRSALPNTVLGTGMLGVFGFLLVNYFRRCGRVRTIQLKKEIERGNQTEKELYHSLRQLELILHTAQEGIIGIDRSGLITFANPTACELIGYPLSELQGMDYMKLVNYEPADESLFLNLPCVPVKYLTGELQFCRKDQTSFPSEFTKNPILDELGACQGAVITFQDISDRKAQEASILRYTKELERSNRDLDNFAYVASHDLKAPLRGIMQLAQWIKEDVEPTLKPQTKSYFNLLENRAQRLERLLEDLLQYSRVGHKHGDFKTVDLFHLTRDIFTILAPPEGFRFVCDANMSRITTLTVPLAQVLRNLMSNAIKHHDKESGLIMMSFKDKGCKYEFCISDDGPGIPEKHHERIFRIFHTLKPRDEIEGSGMGLAIVKKILDNFNCSINISRNGTRGTSMTFTWPTETKMRELVHE